MHIIYFFLKNNDIQNMRASFLLELFLKGIEVFYFANCVCGKPFGDENFCLAYFLQGSLFQIFYNKLSKQNDRIQIVINISYSFFFL